MKKRKKNYGTCVYCGNNRELTRDHVPPLNLFSKPRPDNLITVPSCSCCNNLASKDDEYFRLNIVSREDTPISPGAREVYQTTVRGLGRLEHSGLKNDLRSRTYIDEKYSPSGIHLGLVVKYDIDAHRMDEVAKRIVKGLYYYKFGERLSDEYFVSAFSPSGQSRVPQDLHDIVNQLKTQPKKVVGNGSVFTYYCRTHINNDPYISQWLLTFYRKTEFLGFTIPNQPKANFDFSSTSYIDF